MDRLKKWTLTGCILWIVGLAAFIVGLNLEGDVKAWTNVIGSIVFLTGLGVMGAVWVINKKKEEETEEK